MPSVCSAVWPSSLTCTSIPLRSSQSWKSASEAFASSTIPGTFFWNADTWSATGLASRKPIPTTTRITVAITASTATPRGKRARRSSATNGFSSSAISPATMNSSTIAPAARSTATTPSTASGSSTSCTQRGSSTGSTRAGGGVFGSGSGAIVRSMRSAVDSVCAHGADTSILFVGDVVGRTGRRALESLLPALREELAPTFVVVNGENAAGGIGITPKEADALFAMGVDAITLGNHTYRHREIWPYLAGAPRDRAPGQLPADPARAAAPAWSSATARRSASSTSAATSTCRPAARRCVTVDEALREVSGADHVLVDMHAEATSEKVALGWYLDGKVTAVVGHPHARARRPTRACSPAGPPTSPTSA